MGEKIKATRIEFTYKEGRTDQMPKEWPVVCEGPDCWALAHKQLLDWSEVAPKTGGYDKTDFTVTYADGQTYSGRYDLKHTSIEPVDLPGHMQGFLGFYAGRMRPDHLTEERYRSFLATVPEDDKLGAAQFLDTYEIG